MTVNDLLDLDIGVPQQPPSYIFKLKTETRIFYEIVLNEGAYLIGEFGSHHDMLINTNNPKYFIDHPFLEKEFI